MRGATIGLLSAAFVVAAGGCHTTHLGKLGGCSTGACPSCSKAHDGSGPLGLGVAAHFHGHPASPPDYVGRGRGLPGDIMSGDATATVAYPYYTVRGPRDFFVNNPPSLGP